MGLGHLGKLLRQVKYRKGLPTEPSPGRSSGQDGWLPWRTLSKPNLKCES